MRYFTSKKPVILLLRLLHSLCTHVLLGIGQVKPITSLLLFFKIATSAFSTFLCDFYLIWSAETSTGWIWTNFWAVQGWYDLEECRIWNKLKRPSAGYFPFTHWQIIGDLGFWMVQLANFHCLSVFWRFRYSLMLSCLRLSLCLSRHSS